MGRTVNDLRRLTMLIPLLTCGCVGYWNTNQTSQASFSGSSTFGGRSEPLPLPIHIFGMPSNIDTETRQALSSMQKSISKAEPVRRVLLLADCGLAAAYANDRPLAKHLLGQAMVRMGNGDAEGNESTSRAVSISGKENQKIFRGEPHERSFVSLCRGLTYLAEGDIENAHACLKRGALQDSLAESSTERADWLSIDLLLLECKRRGRFQDYEDWKQYIRTRYDADELPLGWDESESAPLLVLLAVGQAPVKIAAKTKGQELRYVAQPSRVTEVAVTLGGSTAYCTKPVDDIYVQAVTRGRRNMDDVLERKAGLRKGIEGVGSVAALAAPLAGGPAMLGLMLLKEASWSLSDGVGSEADVRQLRMVPDRLYLLFIRPSTAERDAKLELFGADGSVLARGGIPLPTTSRCQLSLVRFAY
jgi:hypothetical protein